MLAKTLVDLVSPALRYDIDVLRPEELPALLAEICQAIGIAATLALIERFGGLRVYIPHESALHESHSLVEALGMPAACDLCRHVAPTRGLELWIPSGRNALVRARNRLLRADSAQGMSVALLAQRYQLHMRTVWQILADTEQAREDRQMRLF